MKEKIKIDCENCIFYDQVIREKNHKIAVLERALKKAGAELCRELSCGVCPVDDKCNGNCEQAFSDYFIAQAEKELKNK